MQLSFAESGHGPPVVLLHGFPLDRTLWENQTALLAPRYRVITPDLPGHGESPIPADLTTVDGMADGVIGLLDGLK